MIEACNRFEAELRPFDPEGADREHFQKHHTHVPDYERVMRS